MSAPKAVRTRRLVMGGVLVIILLSVAAAVVIPALATPARPSVNTRHIDGPTVKVLRQDLATVTSVDGILGYGTPVPIAPRATGTITWLPPIGQSLTRDSVLMRVDERPVVVFFGTTPLYRALDAPALRGADVSMVAANLIAAGVLPKSDPAKASTDTRFMAAVSSWQKLVGLPQTGTLAPGDVQVLAGAARVAAVSARPGDAAGGAALSITGLDKVVSAQVDPARAGALKTGMPVTVVLADGTRSPGRISNIGTVVSTGEGGPADPGPKMLIVVSLDDQQATAAIESSPVSVVMTAETRPQVLVLPIAALLALREGGYAVQTPAGRLIGVTTGLFSGDLVEVSGTALREGLTVVTAR